MNESPSTSNNTIALRRLLPMIAVGSFVLLLCLGMLLLNWQTAQSRPLKPARPSPTPNPLLIEREPTSLSLSQLNEAPEAYIGRFIQVSGSPTRLTPPTCSPFNGPAIGWALVGEELQLNGQGFDRLLRQVAPDVTVTVKGIWRLYRGPLGCGKGPASGTLWYIDVTRIVAPNPLPLRDGTMLDITVQPADPLATLAPDTPADPDQPPTADGTATPTPSPSPTARADTPATPTPTATDDPARTNTPTPTRGINTPPAPPPGTTATNTPTPSLSPTPSPTSASGQPPPPPPATATPGSYDPPPPAPPPATPIPTPYD